MVKKEIIQEELKENKVSVKDLSNKTQDLVSIDNLIEYLDEKACLSHE